MSKKFTLVPLERLMKLSKEVLADKNASKQSKATAAEALNDLKSMEAEVRAFPALVARARKRCDDELEIDDKPILAVGDVGAWVNSWVWVDFTGPETRRADVREQREKSAAYSK